MTKEIHPNLWNPETHFEESSLRIAQSLSQEDLIEGGYLKLPRCMGREDEIRLNLIL